MYLGLGLEFAVPSFGLSTVFTYRRLLDRKAAENAADLTAGNYAGPHRREPRKAIEQQSNNEDLTEQDRHAIYQALDEKAREIRLLRVHAPTESQNAETDRRSIICDMTIASLDDPSLEYDAVSYVWGAAVYSSKIEVNGRTFGVTQNVFDMLSLLLKRGLFQRPIWIDAVCIDQSNTSERSQQVASMRYIYQKADTVHICLGNGTERSVETIESLKAVASSANVRSLVASGKLTNAHLRDLFSCPWWTRLWVLQEAALARKPIAHWGVTSIPFWELTEAMNVAKTAKLHGVFDRMVEAREHDTNDWLHNFDWAAYTFAVLRSNDLTPEMVLSVSSNLNATDERDRIYGVLAMMPSLPSLLPDYTLPAFEVFRQTAISIMRSQGSLRLLRLVKRSARSRMVSSISWVPDFNSAGGLIGVHKDRFGAGAVDPADPFLLREVGQRGVRVNAFVVDRIDFVGVSIQTERTPDTGFPKQDNLTLQHYRKTLRTWLTLMPSRPDESSVQESLDASDPLTQSALPERDEFWRTMLCDGLFSLVSSIPTPNFETAIQRYDEWLLDDNDIVTLSLYQQQQLVLLIGSSNFFVTKAGRMGLSRSDVQAGDEIALLGGETIPYVLRSYPGTTSHLYSVVGSCFCNGRCSRSPKKPCFMH